MMHVRTVIVDDEPLAIERLRMALGDIEGVEVVGDARDGTAAVAAIRKASPDLVLMDIRIPGLNGVEVAQALREQSDAHVVFVTAFSRVAPQAFEVAAVDHLVKPVELDRLRTAVDRVRERMTTRAALRETAGTEPDAPAAGGHRREFWVRRRGRSIRVPVEAVRRLEAEADYVRLHTIDDTFLLRGAMSEMERALDPRAFVRVHRSHMVRIEHITRIDRCEQGSTILRLDRGEQVPISRRLKTSVKARIGAR
jgi:two-component system, LytTR family, response regulator